MENQKRFNTFEGISYTDNEIRNGIERLGKGFSNFEIKDCKVIIETVDWTYRHGISPQECFEIKTFTFKRYSRRINAVVAYLDRVTVADRVRKDDVSVMDWMQNFSLAQITEFISSAQESQATNVLAALLEYKNEHFADYDPMVEFTLEW